jgi:hypothetical protein
MAQLAASALRTVVEPSTPISGGTRAMARTPKDREPSPAAGSAAAGRARRGPRVARAISHLDAVDTDLLRIAPSSWVYGQLPGLLTQARKLLPADDYRRRRLDVAVVMVQGSLVGAAVGAAGDGGTDGRFR